MSYMYRRFREFILIPETFSDKEYAELRAWAVSEWKKMVGPLGGPWVVRSPNVYIMEYNDKIGDPHQVIIIASDIDKANDIFEEQLGNTTSGIGEWCVTRISIKDGALVTLR